MTITTPGRVPTPTPLVLQNISVDYDAIEQSMIADLQRQGSWSSLLPSSTGRAIIRWISSVCAFMMGGIARALQENYPDTARTPGGVYRAQRLFQGSSIIRVRCGALRATVSRTDHLATNLVIPQYNQWTVGGYQFFNRATVVVPGSGQTSATLYQGTVTTAPAVSDGTTFQRFVVGTPNQWDASNDDLFATDAFGNQWTFITTGLWRAGATNTFRASTLPDGTIECRFGDGTYGNVPPIGSLVFTYVSALTNAQTQAGPPVGSAVTPRASFTVTAVTTSAAPANQNPPGPEFYKAIGPGQASNNGRAVSRADYRAVALQYDGVIDVAFRGQAELNPSDIRFMNIVAVTLITTAPWSETDWLEFKNYFESQVAISNVYLIRVDPTPVPIPIELVIGAYPIADDNALTALVESVMSTYFTPRAGSLGATLYPYDIAITIAENATYQQAPNESGSLVDYVDTRQPREPVRLPVTSYPVLGNLTVTVVPSTRGVSSAGTGPILGL